MRPEPSLNRHTTGVCLPPVEECAQHPVYGAGVGVPSAPDTGTGRCAIQPTGTLARVSRRFTAKQTQAVDRFIDHLAAAYPRLGDVDERRAWARVGYRLCELPSETANRIVGQLCEAAGKLAQRNGPPAKLQDLANRLIGGAK